MPLHDLETWMWTEACDILNRADRLQRHFFKPAVMNARRPSWEPPIDVYETSCEFKIMIALPGVELEQMNVTLENGHLLINGHRHLPSSSKGHIRRMEIPYGRFERCLELPVGYCLDIDTLEFVNGCLIISLRKK
jgi:HSP20 family protein